ncbi:HNH endonuclease [Methylopila jiangsuensis]|uniref:HNH endonuclease n=1 Tax=Methylopila jiangsuensis TaxID=586230 RepID=A0A9W6N3V9_9HYPH|nr:HNH endonuclease signature motif containing protein [Methylopila jiangsuensis]MDR6286942.1 5-methylcytosine-specific restriction endonuclease McrA [Methylopila jiangsuensis]GLK76708.1 HNH endonuclease [Methylopila jiangsuensis]
MPMRAPRICGCGHRIASGARCPCETRRDKARRDAFDAKRQSSAARGYDAHWRKVRAAILNAEPWCRNHAARGERVEATEVDHIDGNSRNNATANLRPLCKGCHSARTARDQAFGRRDRGVGRDFAEKGQDRAPPDARNTGDFSFPDDTIQADKKR